MSKSGDSLVLCLVPTVLFLSIYQSTYLSILVKRHICARLFMLCVYLQKYARNSVLGVILNKVICIIVI